MFLKLEVMWNRKLMIFVIFVDKSGYKNSRWQPSLMFCVNIYVNALTGHLMDETNSIAMNVTCVNNRTLSWIKYTFIYVVMSDSIWRTCLKIAKFKHQAYGFISVIVENQ